MITLYCVGIWFHKNIDFIPDIKTADEKAFMTGKKILEAAHSLGLRSSTNDAGHIEMVGYTPQAGDFHPHEPKSFPYVGQPLMLVEQLAGIGQVSHIMQYTATGEIQVPPVENAQFCSNGFSDNCEIRVRLLSIYRASNMKD